MGTSRVAQLTDAAIDLIAESGMRGLTHRAVDGRAGVPLGSTSAYFRTREALIEGVVRRLAELDQADFASDAAIRATVAPVATTRARESQRLNPADLDRWCAAFAALLDRWLSTDRNRTLARYACLLEATHRPQLRRILGHGAAIREQAQSLLARAGAPEAQRRGQHLVAFVDGLLFDRLVGAGALTGPAPGTAANRDDLHAALRTLLAAATGVPSR